jgi:anti-sigma B factor antagonist
VRLELHATPGEVMRAVEALRQLGRERQVPMKILFGLSLALEECGSNIVNYALERDASRTFLVMLEHTGSTIVIELRDRGPEFDPTQAHLTEKKESGDDPSSGGWGIRLARCYTDEMRYTRTGGENVLRLIKKFDLMGRSHQSNNSIQGGNITMKLEIRILQNTGSPRTTTVRLGGSLDTATSPELEHKLSPVLAGPVKDLVFDLAQLKFISSAGLRVLMTARKKLRERGGQAAFINLQPQINEVFEIIKALPETPVFKDVAELDAYLAARQRIYEEDR